MNILNHWLAVHIDPSRIFEGTRDAPILILAQTSYSKEIVHITSSSEVSYMLLEELIDLILPPDFGTLECPPLDLRFVL